MYYNVTCFVTHICYMWHVLWHIYVTCDMFCNKCVTGNFICNLCILVVACYMSPILQLTCYVTSICYIWHVMRQTLEGHDIWMYIFHWHVTGHSYFTCDMLCDMYLMERHSVAITWYMAHTHTHTQPTHPTHTPIHTHAYTYTHQGTLTEGEGPARLTLY